MAVTAIDAEAADVMLMTERHRLIAKDADAGHVIGAHKLRPRPAHGKQDEQGAEDADLRNGIEAAVKNLGHRCLPCFKDSTALGNRPCALIRRGKEEQALCRLPRVYLGEVA